MKKDKKSVYGRTERIMASSGGGGGGVHFSNKNWEGGIIFTTKYFSNKGNPGSQKTYW